MAAQIKAVQSGSVQFDDSDTSVAVPIAAIDPSRAYLVFGARFQATLYDRIVIRGRIASATQIVFDRAASGNNGDMVVFWYVVEFASGVSVQRGTHTMASTADNITIGSVDTAKAFSTVSNTAPDGSERDQPMIRSAITGATTLNLAVNEANSQDCAWQVIEFEDATTVQTGTITSGTSATPAISEVDLSRSFVYGEQRMSTAFVNDIWRGRFASSTQLAFARASTDSGELYWYVVELEDAAVQHATMAMANSSLTDDAMIAAVDTDRAYVGTSTHWTYGTGVADNVNLGRVMVTAEFTSATNVRLTRTDSTGAADFEVFVVAFPEPTDGPTTAQPGTGAAQVAGLAPTIRTDGPIWARPGTGALAATGHAPTITADGSVTVRPGLATLASAGLAPRVTGDPPPPAIAAPRSMRIELWSDLACAGGEFVASVRYASATMRRGLDNSDTLDLSVGPAEPWLAELQNGGAFRVTTETGAVTEWRIGAVRRADGVGAGLWRFQGVPPLVDLGGIILRNVWAGGPTDYNLGGIDLTPRQYLRTFLMPAAQEQGVGYFELGAIEFDAPLTLSWNPYTGLELVHAILEKLKRAELAFERDGDDRYLLSIVERRGASASPVVFSPSRWLEILEEERRPAQVKTALIPHGKVVDGAVENATIAHAVFEVVDVDGEWYEIADPRDRFAAVLYDDQYGGHAELPNLWALLPDGSLEEITDTDAATQRIRIPGAAGLGVGDRIELRADGDGTLVTEIRHPAAVEAHGWRVGHVEDSEARGERNHVPNPRGDVSGDPLEIVACLKDGATAPTTSVAVKGLPPGFEVNAGDRLAKLATAGQTSAQVTADTTANGSGEATLTIGASLSFAADEKLYLYRTAGRMPDGWALPTGARLALPGHRDSRETGDLECQADGAYNTGSGQMPTVAVKGLTEGDKVQLGDWLNRGGTRWPIVGTAVADGAGKATLTLAPATISGSNDDAFTIERPRFEDAGGDLLVLHEVRNTSDSTTVGPAETPPFTVRHFAGMPPLWASVGYTVRSLAGVTLEASGTKRPPRLTLVDADTDTVLASAVAAEETIPARGQVDRVLRVPFQLDQTRSLALRIQGIRHISSSVGGEQGPDNQVFVRWVMLHAGYDPAPPFTPDSHANELLRFGLATIAEASRVPVTYRARVLDLARAGILPAEDESLVLGGTAYVHSPGLGLSAPLRISALVERGESAAGTEVVLESISPRITEIIARRRPRPMYVQVPIVIVGEGGGGGTPTAPVGDELKTVKALPSVPSETDQAVRAIAPSVADDPDPDPDSPVDLKRYRVGMPPEDLLPEAEV